MEQIKPDCLRTGSFSVPNITILGVTAESSSPAHPPTGRRWHIVQPGSKTDVEGLGLTCLSSTGVFIWLSGSWFFI